MGGLSHYNWFPRPEFPELEQFWVHASAHDNLTSLLEKGKVYANKHFSEQNIFSRIAVPFSNEEASKRSRDHFVYLSQNINSSIPEVAINLHSRYYSEEDLNFFLYSRASGLPELKIPTVRFYYDSEKFSIFNPNLVLENKEVKVFDNFDLYEGLVLALIPKVAVDNLSDKGLLERLNDKYIVFNPPNWINKNIRWYIHWCNHLFLDEVGKIL